jgi:hypothetical protein
MGKPLGTPIHLLHNSRSRRTSKVATGRRLFVEGDGRSAWALRWKDLILAHVSDLGGPETLSEAQISICRRAAAMECELEAMEGRMSAGEPIDIGVYARLTGCLCRLLELVGISRLTKPLDPTGELAKALEAYPAKAIDDYGEGDGDDEPVAIEAVVDPDPTDPA